MELFGVYIKFLRCGSGNLSTFWMLYMDTIDILLGLIRASREGDWMLHLASVRAMIPWCFAYDRLNYARYLPCYNALVSQLPTTLPSVHAEFMQEGFSSQAWLQQPLRKNPCRSNDRRNGEQGHTDARGTKRFSLKPGAVSRYYLTAEYRAVYLKTLRDMIGQGSSKLPHPAI